MSAVMVLSLCCALLSSALITLVVVASVLAHRLRRARRHVARINRPRGQARRRRRLSPAALVVRSAWKTADEVLVRGVGAVVRNSVDDLAAWARVERPDLARVTAGDEVVIVFSDIESSTERNAELGDGEWVALLDRHDDLVRSTVRRHRGHVVKNQGDGYMIAFADAGSAVRWAISLQHTLCDRPGSWHHIRVRIGVHSGPSVRRGQDIFGLNVATAARVAGQAGGQETLITDPVRKALDGVTDVAIGEVRTVELKGVPGVHPLYPVRAANA